MNRKQYEQKRNELMNEVNALIEKGDPDAAQAKMDEVKALDEEFDKMATAQANAQALQEAVPARNALNFGEGSNTETNEETEEITAASEVYAQAWVRAMHGDKLNNEEQEVLDAVNVSNSTTKEHTLVIPETYRKGIWERAAELHPVINDLMSTFVKGDLIIIKDTSETDDAEWIDESDPSPDTKFTEGSLRLTGCELAKSITLSWKLKKMSMDEYIPYIIRKLGAKVGNAIAKSLFDGKGKPQPGDTFKEQAKGVLVALAEEAGTPQIVEYTTNITYKNLTSLMSVVKSAYKSGASIYANNVTVWNQLANILDENKRPIFIPDVVNSGGVGRIFGIPVKEEDGVSDGVVVIGNYPEGYVFNFNEQMSIYQEDHVKPRTTDYMAYGIADGDVLDTKAFGVLQKKSS